MGSSIKGFTHVEIVKRMQKFAHEVGFVPSDAQRQVLESDKRFRICIAGARFGKSMIGGFEAAFYTALFPDYRVWLVAPYFDLADKEHMWAIDFLSKAKLKNGVSLLNMAKICNPSRSSRSLTFPWGSKIETKSTDNPKSLLGDELDLIVLCEGSRIPRRAWEEMLRARLGPRQGRLLMASTGAGDSGLFSEMVNKGLNNEDNDWQTWCFRTIDNPYFSKEEYEKARKELAPDIFKEQYEGQLVSRRGFVFNFRDENILAALPQDIEQKPIIAALQPGFNNPCVVLFMVYNREEQQYIVIDEIYEKGRLISDIADMIKERVKGKRFLGVVTDYWEVSAINELKKCGLMVSCNDAEKKIGHRDSIIARVRTLQTALRVDEDYHSKLKVYQGCTNTINDFKQCKWPDKPAEERDQLESETPLEKYFQAPQALSHVLSFLQQSEGVDIYKLQLKDIRR